MKILSNKTKLSIFSKNRKSITNSRKSIPSIIKNFISSSIVKKIDKHSFLISNSQGVRNILKKFPNQLLNTENEDEIDKFKSLKKLKSRRLFSKKISKKEIGVNEKKNSLKTELFTDLLNSQKPSLKKNSIHNRKLKEPSKYQTEENSNKNNQTEENSNKNNQTKNISFKNFLKINFHQRRPKKMLEKKKFEGWSKSNRKNRKEKSSLQISTGLLKKLSLKQLSKGEKEKTYSLNDLKLKYMRQYANNKGENPKIIHDKTLFLAKAFNLENIHVFNFCSFKIDFMISKFKNLLKLFCFLNTKDEFCEQIIFYASLIENDNFHIFQDIFYKKNHQFLFSHKLETLSILLIFYLHNLKDTKIPQKLNKKHQGGDYELKNSYSKKNQSEIKQLSFISKNLIQNNQNDDLIINSNLMSQKNPTQLKPKEICFLLMELLITNGFLLLKFIRKNLKIIYKKDNEKTRKINLVLKDSNLKKLGCLKNSKLSFLQQNNSQIFAFLILLVNPLNEKAILLEKLSPKFSLNESIHFYFTFFMDKLHCLPFTKSLKREN